eukprot:TRINITY_DN11364_c0_g1_i2.p1 TRINITY_DN11364_c0_g1~~TRINITY_DN11364_c0_g1_i2.p1  ORF type:complete len:543 (+),score=70.33 TRINITY_DN11364_c0_g1_i2:91-1719(+)
MAGTTPAFRDESHALQVLLFLRPPCAVRAGATSKSDVLAAAARTDAFWAACSKRYLALTDPTIGPFGQSTAGSSRVAFGLWYKAILEGDLKDLCNVSSCLPLDYRWVEPWALVRKWTTRQTPGFRAVHRTLRPGLSRDRLQQILAEEQWESIDPSIFGFWSVCDGQDVKFPHSIRHASALGMPAAATHEEHLEALFLGLFGGFSCYNVKHTTILFPLKSAIRATKLVYTHMKNILPDDRGKLLCFAGSYDLSKTFWLSLLDGSVWMLFASGSGDCAEEAAPTSQPAIGSSVTLEGLVGKPELNGLTGTIDGFNKERQRWMVRMADGSGVHLVKQTNLKGFDIGLLRWFREYARRLDTGFYESAQIMPEAGNQTLGISLYPRTAEGGQTRAVTRGVEVTASCIYTGSPQMGWTYSIALRLVGTPEERGFKTCQLAIRVWKIRDDAEPMAREVKGDGVVGFFPILTDGGWILHEESDPNQQYEMTEGLIEGEFRYQSCSGGINGSTGSFAGELQFYPGTRRNPTGQPFMAKLEKFTMAVPSFKY